MLSLLAPVLPAPNQPDTSGLDQFNPLKMSGVERDIVRAESFTTPSAIISEALRWAIPIAGLILFVMIVWGGFEILSGASSTKSREAGKQRITAAVTGFFLLFAAYWIVQLIQIVFKVQILG